MGAVAPLGPAARVRRRREGWPRQGTRGSGFSLGAFRTVLRTRPWASRRHGSTRGRCTRLGGITAAGGNSGEKSRAKQGSNDQIKGMSRFLASSRSAGVARQRRRRKGLTGRRWWSSDCTGGSPVSAGWADQRD
jgi:hypothetical protein